jgi:type I restriction enzyme R subunit
VIEIDRVTMDVDLSDLDLKRVKQIDRGRASLSLGERDAALPVISGAGSGSVNANPQLVRLADVVARINDLFGGELDPEDIEGFVKPVATKAEAAPGIADQIDNNAKDQFLDSRSMRDSIIDAIFETDSAMGRLASTAMGENARAEELIRLIGEFIWETRRQRNAN